MYTKLISAIQELHWFLQINIIIIISTVILTILRSFLIVPKSIKEKHVVITGGSSGIGKALGVLAAELGANVTIIARNSEKLRLALNEIQEACKNATQIVKALSVDVSDYAALENELNHIDNIDPIYMLINCAGLAICGEVEKLSLEEMETMIKTNFCGSLYPTQIIVPKMKSRKQGIIVFTASQAALIGIYGLSVYSGTKFGIRGFAEAVDMEVKPYNITVTVALPPDTDTPGYYTENIKKPMETRLISEGGGLYKPEIVAKKIINDALRGAFYSFVGMESFILTTLCAGMSKCSSLFDLIVQVYFMGIFRLICICIKIYFDRIIKGCLKTKTKTE